eukprot:COSAG02_NODE_953_length_15689_cov_112.180564_11_plen_184_part_00
MYARIYCIYHACMPVPSSSIMPGFCGRDTGHKALCPVSLSMLQIYLGLCQCGIAKTTSKTPMMIVLQRSRGPSSAGARIASDLRLGRPLQQHFKCLCFAMIENFLRRTTRYAPGLIAFICAAIELLLDAIAHGSDYIRAPRKTPSGATTAPPLSSAASLIGKSGRPKRLNSSWAKLNVNSVSA